MNWENHLLKLKYRQKYENQKRKKFKEHKSEMPKKPSSKALKKSLKEKDNNK